MNEVNAVSRSEGATKRALVRFGNCLLLDESQASVVCLHSPTLLWPTVELCSCLAQGVRKGLSGALNTRERAGLCFSIIIRVRRF